VGFQTLPTSLAPGEAWLIAIAFAMQIYFDFSGFTDIARGSARLLGFEVPQNFHRPYMATNPSEFWRRWHMSLSTWFRDYLYIPLGGRRTSQARNLMITMIVGGLWHGANWTFAIWGAFHGVLLAGYWGIRSLTRRGGSPGSAGGRVARAVIGWPLTFGLVCIGWVFFRAGTFQQALGIVGSMLGVNGGDGVVLTAGQRLIIAGIAVACILFEAVLEVSERLAARERVAHSIPARLLGAVRWQLQPIGYGILIAATLILQPTEGPPFIYFHF
jgi:alginate O-acetyltransferase complex protein AlgI